MNSLLSLLVAPRCEIGFVFARWSVGLCVVYEYLSLYSQRRYFWGGLFGDYGSILSGSFDLYPQTWLLDFVLLSSVALSVSFAAGIGGRLVAIGMYGALLLIHDANSLILDGGDNVLRLVLFYFMFSSNGPRSGLSAVIHNLSVLAVVVQLCCIYFFTGLYKVMGDMWQTGVAMYYVSRVHWFTWPGVSEVIYQNEYFVVLLTYGTVVFELAFPFLLFNRYARWGAIVAGFTFHAGIAVLMGLLGFSWVMLSLYFLLLTDTEYRTIMEAGRRLKDRVVEKRVASSSGDVLLYDGDCIACNRFVSFVFARNATFKAAPMQSAIGRRILDRHGRDARRLESMYVIAGYLSDAEECLDRSDALVFSMAMLDNVFWRGVAWLLGRFPRRLLDAGYRFVAANRHVVGGGEKGCDIKYGERILREKEEEAKDV